MPRGRRPSAARLSPEQAQSVLNELLRSGRVSAAEIGRIMEIAQLEQRLQSLRGGAVVRRGPGRPPRAEGVALVRRRRRRRAPITAEQLASRQLQGRYLGLIRQIPASRRAQYAKVAKEKGREAAIRELQSALKK